MEHSWQLILCKFEALLFLDLVEYSAPHSEGVALMLWKEAEKTLIKWEAASPIFITATFRTIKNNVNLKVIQYFAPRNDKGEPAKEVFYRKLQNAIDNLGKGC